MFKNKGNNSASLSFDDENQSKQSEVKDYSSETKNKFIKKDTKGLSFFKERLKAFNSEQNKKNGTDTFIEYSPSFKPKQQNFYSLTDLPFSSSSNNINNENSSILNSSSSDPFKVPPLPAIRSDAQSLKKIIRLNEIITAIHSLEDGLNIQPHFIAKGKIETQLELAKERLTQLGNIQLEFLEKDLIIEHSDYTDDITSKQQIAVDYENDVLRYDDFLIKTKKCISDLDKIYELFNKINNITCQINKKIYLTSGYDPNSYNDDFLFIIKEFQKNIESHKNDYVTHIKNNDIQKKEISTEVINSKFEQYDELKAEIKSSFIKQITYINESLAELQKSIVFNNVISNPSFLSIDSHLYLSTIIKTLDDISPKNIINTLLTNQLKYYNLAYSVQVLFKEYYKVSQAKMFTASNTHNSTFETRDIDNYSNKLKRNRETLENDDIINKSAKNRITSNNKSIEKLMQDINIIKSFQNRLELIPEMRTWFSVIQNDLNTIVTAIEYNEEITNNIINTHKKIILSLDEKINQYLTNAKKTIDNSKAKDLVLAQDLEIEISLIKFDGSTIKNLDNYISIMKKYLNWKSVKELINNDFSNMEKSFNFEPSTSGILFSNNNLPLSSNKRKRQQFTYGNESLSLKEESSSAPNEVVHQHTKQNKYL